MDAQLRERLTRIRDRLSVVGAVNPTAETWRATCEVVWEELDLILREGDGKAEQRVFATAGNRILVAPASAPEPSSVADVLDSSGRPRPPWKDL